MSESKDQDRANVSSWVALWPSTEAERLWLEAKKNWPYRTETTSDGSTRHIELCPVCREDRLKCRARSKWKRGEKFQHGLFASYWSGRITLEHFKEVAAYLDEGKWAEPLYYMTLNPPRRPRRRARRRRRGLW